MFRVAAVVLFLLLVGGVTARLAIAVDPTAGAAVYGDFCASCHGPARDDKDRILLGADNATAIEIEMQRPGSPMAYLQEILDTGDIANVAAYLGTVQGGGAPAMVPVVEYWHAGFDHYFMTAAAGEIAALDTGRIAGWQRTGQQFGAYAVPAAGTAPVCRFFSTAFAPKSSHFYTPSAPECAHVKTTAEWTFEAEAFHVALPDASGNCPGATRPIYRLYNDGHGDAPNHRYTSDPAIRAQMMAAGWIPEGEGTKQTYTAPGSFFSGNDSNKLLIH